MAQPYLGDIRMFAGNFAILHYAFCNGTLMAISQNQSLFSLLGTNYGGDGRTSFGLPEMRGRVPVNKGTAVGQSLNWNIGTLAGVDTVTLTVDQLPSHNHSFNVSNQSAVTETPEDGSIAEGAHYFTASTLKTTGKLADDALSPTGGGGSHSNQMPYCGINFIIALQGTYPSRN
ncbi:phage tail protein [Bowmanella denitrificans]|uniref:phage tail protein n=1 Tax=Bowmanella denitrificans TaxID=366582 RepID=UPI000C9BE1A8|nr:tail fiber protein [Bowmanella denitrificans]